MTTIQYRVEKYLVKLLSSCLENIINKIRGQTNLYFQHMSLQNFIYLFAWMISAMSLQSACV